MGFFREIGRWRGAAVVLALGIAIAFGLRTASADEANARAVADITWTDINGRSYGKPELAGARATVFVFISTQCPIANAYTPRLLELAKDYQPRGIHFFLVSSNPQDSLADVKRYVRDRKIPFPALKDNDAALADRLDAQVTPQAVILDSAGVVRYTGRIDENQDRSKVVRQDVREALDALLDGRPVKVARTLAFGCVIFRDKAPAPVSLKSAVTYTRDVAPILNANCVVCHRAGEVAPFGLETYAQARTWASALKDYTARRLMPPWKPVESAGAFHDARALTPKQIAVLARWADSHAPEGDAKDLPTPPTFPPPATWTLGTPDLVLQAPRPYHLEAEGKDVYRNFVMPAEFKEDRYLTAIEFQPDNRAVVHHIVTYIDPTGESVKLDGKETEPGYSVTGGGSGIPGEIWGEVWVPGNASRRMPPGVAIKIPAGARLVMQVHYHKTGKPEVDRSRMALYFSKTPVEKVMHVVPAGNAWFELKPGEAGQEVRGRLLLNKGVLPEDAHLHSIFPHMHMLGHDMKVTATLPDGTVKTLIWINDWDFNWQATYFYKEPIALPKGTKIELVALYDNSSRNPRQTSNPPVTVRYGEQTTDEMCFCFLGLTLDSENLGVSAKTALSPAAAENKIETP